MTYIPEIELNFSNICGANCFMCSKPHGCGNIQFMPQEVFDALIGQLKDCEVGQFQTSGNGECLLNPNYLNYLRTLKKEFPNVERWCYNNFSMMRYEISKQIIDEVLINKMHARVESLDPEVMRKSSRLNFDLVIENIKHFLQLNDKNQVPLIILYNNPGDYYKKCMKVLGKPPQYWPFGDRTDFPNEEQDIRNFFQRWSNYPINSFRINHCLWAERENCQPDTKEPCPKINVIKRVMWVSPNGDVQGCCYDDTQSHFVLGNILNTHIADIFNGEERAEFIRKIENREITDYPCVNPKCCNFDEGLEK